MYINTHHMPQSRLFKQVFKFFQVLLEMSDWMETPLSLQGGLYAPVLQPPVIIKYIKYCFLPLGTSLWQKREGEPSCHTAHRRPPQSYSEVIPCSPSRITDCFCVSVCLLVIQLQTSLVSTCSSKCCKNVTQIQSGLKLQLHAVCCTFDYMLCAMLSSSAPPVI